MAGALAVGRHHAELVAVLIGRLLAFFKDVDVLVDLAFRGHMKLTVQVPAITLSYAVFAILDDGFHRTQVEIVIDHRVLVAESAVARLPITDDDEVAAAVGLGGEAAIRTVERD